MCGRRLMGRSTLIPGFKCQHKRALAWGNSATLTKTLQSKDIKSRIIKGRAFKDKVTCFFFWSVCVSPLNAFTSVHDNAKWFPPMRSVSHIWALSTISSNYVLRNLTTLNGIPNVLTTNTTFVPQQHCPILWKYRKTDFMLFLWESFLVT